MRGAFFDELLQIALVIAVFRDQPAMLQRAADAEEKLILFERLQDVVVGAAANGFESGGDVVDGGDHDHRNFGVVLRSQSSSLMPSISGMIMSLRTRSGVTRLT